jgi:beta-1,4-N-acetylglucosaminyltransferase
VRQPTPQMPGNKQPIRPPIDVLLVSSTGGHLLQMHLLRDAWAGLDRVWVSHDTDDARSLLKDETVFFAHWPTTRHVPNLARNLVLAWRLISTLKPRAIISAGAGVAVPFLWIGRLRGSKVVYVESLTRVGQPSLSCRLISPVAHRVYAQWPELTSTLPNARFVGNVLGES